MIISKLRASVRPPVRLRKIGKKRLDCARLEADEARNSLRSSIAGKLQEIDPFLSPEGSVDDNWTCLSSKLYEAAAESIGYRRRRHQDWFDENSESIRTKLDTMHKAHNAALNNPTSVRLKQHWRTSRKEVQSVLRKLKNDWWTDKAQEIEHFAVKNDMHNFYNAVKTIHGPRNSSLSPVKSADGSTLIKDQKQVVDRWAEHFQTLLNQPATPDLAVLDELPSYQTIEELDLPPTFSEVLAAIRSLKNNKTPGPDGIPAEILKQGGYLCTRAIFHYIADIWKRGAVPQQWRDANVVTIYKGKGEKSVCGNSRGISLLSAAGKVLAKVMLSRLIQSITEHLLPESQCGFRKNRSTVDMIFTTRQLQEKCREQHQDLYMAFVDLSKAFDTVNRDLLWAVLLRVGCPRKFVNILQSFHEGMMAQVTTGGHESRPFKVSTGVRQGCVLAPVLFNIFLMSVTWLLHKEVEGSSGVLVDYRLDGSLFNIRRLQAATKVKTVNIVELQYADDCAFVAHTSEALQATLTAAVKAYSRLGLTVNTVKTEVLCQWNSPPPTRPPSPVFNIDDKPLAIVPDFKYLGSILSENCSMDNDVQNRIRSASASFGRLRKRVYVNKDLSIRTKVAVYQAICVSTLLYGCEAWTLYRRHIQQLENFHIKCLQRILGLTWRDRVPHTEVLSKTGTKSMEATFLQYQLRWAGHTIRMSVDRLPRQLLYGQLHHGQRSAGGQKRRYKDQLKITLKRCGIQHTQLESSASDRPLWRQLCHAGLQHFEEERSAAREGKRQRRKMGPAAKTTTNTNFICPHCNRPCGSRIGLFSHLKTHQ
ncbi:uncharacterized protein LOC133635724 [Entelurus aequoreus]|uniref:uncharacterized protein LOC133635724 n=1 Tax=Entelurus aequoreus TaxID=161455 RepID=UPI002B1E679A|nr:uncharacterized protein LOC133635724 [Entelurus aequoreus]